MFRGRAGEWFGDGLRLNAGGNFSTGRAVGIRAGSGDRGRGGRGGGGGG